jgi:transcription elongation factor GreA
MGILMIEKVREALREEMKKLDRELRFELPQEIQVARALGDLRENAEYHAARERQTFVQARLAQIRRKLADLSTFNAGVLPRDSAALGSVITLLDLDSSVELSYELVIGEESDVARGRISVNSPIGRGLLGGKEGDERSIQVPAGIKRYEIIKLVTIHDRDSGAGE